jgi:hypothetical protein
MAKGQLELPDEPGQRLPVAVQSLEYDGRSVLEQVKHLASVHESSERLAGQGRGTGEQRGSQDVSVLGDAQCWCPQRRARQQMVDVVE